MTHDDVMVPARIQGFLARQASVAVILRCGPARWTEMLRWNLETDEVTAGQWLKARVYGEDCDFSPDGERFVALCATHVPNHRAAAEHGVPLEMTELWTAVSRPPYFTAVALTFEPGSFSGGGFWDSNKRLLTCSSPFSSREVRPAECTVVHKFDQEGHASVAELRRRHGGWSSTFSEETRTTRWEKPFEGGRVALTESWRERPRWTIEDDAGAVRREWRPGAFQSQFLDVDPCGRVIFGDGGCLWAWSGCPDGEPAMIADLNGHVFRELAPPTWATRWD